MMYFALLFLEVPGKKKMTYDDRGNFTPNVLAGLVHKSSMRNGIHPGRQYLKIPQKWGYPCRFIILKNRLVHKSSMRNGIHPGRQYLKIPLKCGYPCRFIF